MKNSIKIDGKEVELPDELILKIKEQLSSKTKEEEMEQFFLNCLNDCSILIKNEYPNSVFYIKDNVVWMEYESKNKYFYIRYHKIWSIFESKFGLDYASIQSFTQSMVEKHLKLSGVTTNFCYNTINDLVEKHLKLSGVTT